MRKVCTRCGKVKPLSDFYKQNADHYRGDCKVCHRKTMKPRSAEHYHANKAYYRARNVRRLLAVNEFIRSFKVSKGCADCGIQHPHWRLDFDHLDPRLKECELSGIGRLGWSRERTLREIAKCEVVCANCHRDRTWSRNEGERRNKRRAASSGRPARHRQR